MIFLIQHFLTEETRSFIRKQQKHFLKVMLMIVWLIRRWIRRVDPESSVPLPVLQMPRYKTSCCIRTATWATAARGGGCSRPARYSCRAAFSSSPSSRSTPPSGPTRAWSGPTSANPTTVWASWSGQETAAVSLLSLLNTCKRPVWKNEFCDSTWKDAVRLESVDRD